MRKLAIKYKKSAELLSVRVKELSELREFLIKHTKDPEKDPEIIQLSDRIRPLNTMLNDIREVTREIKHYYDKGWWRSEKYTFNQRKSRKHYYIEPIYDSAIDEPEQQGADEEIAVSID